MDFEYDIFSGHFHTLRKNSTGKSFETFTDKNKAPSSSLVSILSK
jgi:hypothetical protein